MKIESAVIRQRSECHRSVHGTRRLQPISAAHRHCGSAAFAFRIRITQQGQALRRSYTEGDNTRRVHGGGLPADGFEEEAGATARTGNSDPPFAEKTRQGMIRAGTSEASARRADHVNDQSISFFRTATGPLESMPTGEVAQLRRRA